MKKLKNFMELIDGDFFESLADISYGDTYQNFRNIDVNEIINFKKNRLIIFINTERLINLLNICGSITNKEIIIVSHNSDITISNIENIPNNIIHIFLQNYNGTQYDKITPLPIGLERRRWFPEERKQDKIIDNINKGLTYDKQIDTYMNFNHKTNPIRNKWYLKLKDYQNIFIENLGNGNSFDNYVERLLTSRYVLSPPGNGIDCHRNWECLYLGVIPIIQRSNFTEYIYSDMGAILIDDIDNYDPLNIEEYKRDISKLELKLSTKYWEEKIKKSC